jgi:hypothetical protein
MNCSQIDNFLPLYAGQDLDDRRQHAIAAHLEACEVCASAFAEYRETRNLLNGFAAPEIDEEVFEQIRRGVWRRIESESNRPSSLETMRDWFQPRFVWVVAAAVCLVVCAVALYSLANRFAVQPRMVIDNPKGIAQPRIEAVEDPGNNFANLNPGTLSPRQTDVPKRRRRPDYTRAPERTDSLVVYSPDTQITKTDSSWPLPQTEASGDPAGNSDKTLRMEIQTRNPNIRIIWFSQRDARPAAAHTKGT